MIEIDRQDAANRLAALLRLARSERHAAAIFLGLDAGVVDLLPTFVESEVPTVPDLAMYDARLLGQFVLSEAVIQGHIAAFRSRDKDSGESR